MSNPGVVKLASLTRGDKFSRFDIEDNIGESIHIHLDNLRLDLSILEFLDIAQRIEEILAENPSLLPALNLPSHNVAFLSEISHLLPYVTSECITTIPLTKLKALVRKHIWRGFYSLSSLPITSSPAYLFLQKHHGNLFELYPQSSLPGISNIHRLSSIQSEIEKHGYPGNIGYITLFGDQPYIRDGLHRASVLAHLYGPEAHVPVRIIEFSNSAWRISPLRDTVASFSRNILKIMSSKYRSLTS